MKIFHYRMEVPMSEKEILDKIKKSAEQEEIPESIHPEKMK